MVTSATSTVSERGSLMTGLIVLVVVVWALVFVPIVWFTFYRARKSKVEQQIKAREQADYWATHDKNPHDAPS